MTDRTNVIGKVPWFHLGRFGLRTRDDYVKAFDKVEGVIAVFAIEVKALANSDYSQDGIFKRLIGPRETAFNGARGLLEQIGVDAEADLDQVQAIIEAPDAPRSMETLAALQYAQALALREFDNTTTNTNPSKLLGALDRAVAQPDPIRAEVLADLAGATIRPKGPNDVMLLSQIARLQQAAVRLRADPSKRAAFALKAAIEDDGGVLSKLSFAKSALGGRLDLISSHNGQDDLVRTFALDFPMPAGEWGPSRAVLPMSERDLSTLLARWFGSVGITSTAGPSSAPWPGVLS